MSPAIDALTDALARLWPAASDIRVGSRVGAGRPPGSRPVGGVASRTLRFHAVPSIESPRLLVPTSRRAAARAVRRFSCSATPRDVAERTGVAAALRSVGPQRLLPVVDVVGAAGGIDEHLAEVLGRDVVLSVGVGSDRANRKPVLQVFDTTGEPLAHVKVGDTAVATGHVRGEAAALEQIARRRWDSIRVPSVLHHGRWNDHEVLVITSLPASPWQFGARRGFPAAAAAEVARCPDGSPMPLVAVPAWRRWVDAAGSLDDDGRRERLGSAIGSVADRWGGVEVRAGSWHGDFTPWNMAWSGRRLSIWDWERYETGVPVGLDVVHYAVNVAVHDVGFASEPVRAGLARGRVMLGRQPTEVADALVASYLIAISVRYLAASELAGGHVLADSGEVVLGELESLVGRAHRSAA